MTTRRIGRGTRQLLGMIAGGVLALHCALPGFTIVEGDGSGGSGELGGQAGDNSGGSTSGGNHSGGAGGSSSGGGNLGGFGGEGGDSSGGSTSGGSTSGGSASGGDGSGGGSPCGDLGEACCDSGSNGGCDTPYECDVDTCEDLRTWQMQQKLLAALPENAADGSADDYFGQAVAVSGDTAVIGAPYDDAPEGASGSAYVFVRTGSTWAVQQKLTAQVPGGAADSATGDSFGYSVAVSGDTVVIGSLQDDDQGTDSGSAYVFVRSGSTWSIQQKLTAMAPGGTADGAAGDLFGMSVAISGDTLIAGSRANEFDGSAYVFVRSGPVWTVQQKLKAALPDGTDDGATSDFFGASVALDDDTALIGSYSDDDQGSASGSAYVFVRSGTTWAVEQKLTAALPGGQADGDASDNFGASVALDDDTAIIGSHLDDDQGSASGSAYVFGRSGSVWTVQGKLTAALPEGTPDGAADDQFGYSVAVSGETVVVGSYRDAGFAGSSYVFARNVASWSVEQKLTTGEGVMGAFFGYSVAMSGGTLVSGTYGDDDQGSNSGSAYVFAFE